MSTAQLQEVFHVDHPDAVPHYELIQLMHHTNQPSVGRRKRSIETGPSKRGNQLDGGGGGNHHVKKDLSKVRFSEKASESAVPAKKRTVKQPDATGSGGGGSVSEQILPEMQPPAKEPADSDSENKIGDDVSIRDIKQHRVSFSAFGESVNLTLEKTEGLFGEEGPHSLRMWNVRVDPNATQGLVYEEIHEEVSVFQVFSLFVNKKTKRNGYNCNYKLLVLLIKKNEVYLVAVGHHC